MGEEGGGEEQMRNLRSSDLRERPRPHRRGQRNVGPSISRAVELRGACQCSHLLRDWQAHASTLVAQLGVLGDTAGAHATPVLGCNSTHK
jgi:hypothetical protein